MKSSHMIASVAAGGLLTLSGIGFTVYQTSADQTPSPGDASVSSLTSNDIGAATSTGIDQATVTEPLNGTQSEYREDDDDHAYEDDHDDD